MHDLEWLALASGIVYAIGKALQPSKPKQRETVRYTAKRLKHVEIVEPTLPARLTNRRYPMRVPVETALQPIETPRKDTVQPRQRKARRKTGTAPFGMSQEQFKTAQKYLSVGGEAVDYDEAAANNGWLVGLSESEGE